MFNEHYIGTWIPPEEQWNWEF